MPITLDDIRRERERRSADPAQAPAPAAQTQSGITLADIKAERARRAQAGDPFAPKGGTGSPTDEFRTSPSKEGVLEAFPSTLASPDVAAPGIGGVAGGVVGSLTGPLAPVAAPVLSSAGSAAFLALARWMTGEQVTSKDLFQEAGLSLLPEVAVGVGKGVLRASKSARNVRFEDLAKTIRDKAGTLFDPPEKPLVQGLFKQVEDSGVKVDTASMKTFMGKLGRQHTPLIKEIGYIDTKLKTGGEFSDMLREMQAGKVTGYDIGRLQKLHSEVRKRLQKPNLDYEAELLLRNFNGAIDDTIFTGLAKGQRAAAAEPTRNTIRMARAGWARYLRTLELEKIVTNSIHNGRNGTDLIVDLGKIKRTIENATGAPGKSLHKTFEHDPKIKKELYDFLDTMSAQHDKISVSLADLPPHLLGESAAKIGEWMATIYTNTAGREMFKDLMVSGHGRLTHSTLANLANTGRRELGRAYEARKPTYASDAPALGVQDSPP